MEEVVEMMMPNPYLLDDALAGDGLDLDTWHVPTPTMETVNPGVHLAHFTDCQEGAEFVVSWCGIALDEHAQRPGDGSDVGIGDLCVACITVYTSGGRCPVCGTPVVDLAAGADR